MRKEYIALILSILFLLILVILSIRKKPEDITFNKIERIELEFRNGGDLSCRAKNTTIVINDVQEINTISSFVKNLKYKPFIKDKFIDFEIIVYLNLLDDKKKYRLDIMRVYNKYPIRYINSNYTNDSLAKYIVDKMGITCGDR